LKFKQKEEPKPFKGGIGDDVDAFLDELDKEFGRSLSLSGHL